MNEQNLQTFTFLANQKFLVSDLGNLYATSACLLKSGDIILTAVQRFKVETVEVLGAEVNVTVQESI